MKKYRFKINKANLGYIRTLFLIAKNQKDISSFIEKNKKIVSMVFKQIEDIPDAAVRRVIKLRYVDGNTWADVSYKMGYRSHDGSRKVLNKYFADLNK